MKSKVKRFSAIIFVVALLISNCIVKKSAANAEFKSISSEQAKFMAVLQIQSYIVNCEKDAVSKWKWGIRIEEPVPMYSLTREVEAYYVGVVDERNESIGYVIVGANLTHAPIIEYNVSNMFYPEVVRQEIKMDSLYYMGGLRYWVGDYKQIVDATSFGEYKKIEYKRLCNTSVIRGNYNVAWGNWSKLLNSRRIEIKDNIITEPLYRNELIVRGSEKSVVSWNQPYKVMNSFPNKEYHCAPLAAVNLCLYWRNRCGAQYANLRKPNDNLWWNTLDELYVLMRTNQQTNGTLPGDIDNGLRQYIRTTGYRARVSMEGNACWQKAVYEINEDRPIIVGYYYPIETDMMGHAMLALGYSNINGRQIRVADGYSGYASRFLEFMDHVEYVESLEFY